MDYHKIKARFIEIFEDMAEKHGYKSLNGHILALFLLHKKPLTQAEIEKMTGYSRSAISRALDQMTRIGTLRKRRQPGTRTISYTTEATLPTIMTNAIRQWLRGTEELQRNVKILLKEFPENPPPNVSDDEFYSLKQTLHQLDIFIDKAKKLFNELIQQLMAS